MCKRGSSEVQQLTLLSLLPVIESGTSFPSVATPNRVYLGCEPGAKDRPTTGRQHTELPRLRTGMAGYFWHRKLAELQVTPCRYS